MSLNHYWTISDKTSLSTVAYASYGTGGGGGTAGTNKFTFESNGQSDYRDGLYGPINFDKIVDENIASGANGSETILRASHNDHNWFGILSTLKTDLTDNIDSMNDEVSKSDIIEILKQNQEFKELIVEQNKQYYSTNF